MHAFAELRDDRRGAVLVVGVVMGALLVGALYHIIGVGNAIMWRERAQDAADAGAFETAVWNARGMNMLVAINLIMQVIMAVLVVWRILLLIAGILVLLSGILCAVTFGFGCSFTVEAAQVANRMRQMDPTIAKTIMRILGAMRASQVVVATAPPALGAILTSGHVKGAYGGVSSAMTYSSSLIPSVNLEAEREIAQCFGRRPKPKADPSRFDKFRGWFAGNVPPRLGVPVSLPVSADDASVLCDKGGQLVTQALAKALDLAHLPGGKAVEKAKGMVGGMVKKNQALFCKPFGGAMPEELSDEIMGPARKACEEDFAKIELRDRVMVSGPDGNEPKWRKYGEPKTTTNYQTKAEWIADCVKDKTKEAREKLGQTLDDEASDAAEACSRPSKVWDLAANGDIFMRSFSTIARTDDRSVSDGKGIDVGDSTRTGNVQNVQTERIAAHAEMYFDTENGWGSAASEAMWDVRWRARLRRVQPISTLAATTVEREVMEKFTKLLDDGLEAVGVAIADHLHLPKEAYTEIQKTDAFKNFHDGITQKARNGYTSVADALHFGSARSPVIH